MRTPFRLGVIALLTSVAVSAHAVEVTNLDDIEHKVVLDLAGTKELRTIAPGETERFAGQPNGLLSLVTAKKSVKSKGAIQSDGLLSGYLGNGRTEGIPCEDGDSFVIWEDGKMMLQQRRRGGRMRR